MRKNRILSGSAAVLLSLLVATATPAQNLDPSSSANVLPSATSGDVASIEARRRALFQQMLQDPSNLDVAFEYAALSQRAGDLEAAISTLERMLIFAPGLPRLQFELGVLYFRLGAYETAAAYLRPLADDPSVPGDIRGEIALYLQAIEERARGTYFAGRVAAGVRYQTNANAGPASVNLNLNGLNFLLSPTAMGTPDSNAFVTGNFRASIDLQNQGDRFDISASAYGSVYRTLNALNTGVVELRAGPTLNLQRFSIDNAFLALYGIAGGGILGGNPYLATLGAGAELTFVLDARSRVQVKGEARYESYFDTALRPTASLRSGMRYSAAATYRYQLTSDLGIFVTLGADRRQAQRGFLSNWLVSARAGVVYRFDSPIEMLDEPWSVSLSAGASQLTGDAPDPIFSATNVERTTQAFVEGTLTVPLPHAFALELNANYTWSNSNYGLSTFQNFGVAAAVSKGF